ncbi:oligosaccharide flippase family protein [Nitrospira sp. MA-1]|nr:oligosaccharide flippase family protein [Nitrospira sp. MA-1]
MDGTVRVFLAGLLFPLTGLITAGFLTRRLGTDGYGLLVLSATLFGWVELGINSFFARPAIKFIGEAKNWLPVGSTLIRLQFVAGVVGGVLLGLLAFPLAWLLDEPLLAPYLALFALHIPISSLTQAHQSILVGIGNFRQKAVTNACRWIARLLLILVLVEMGLSVPGAIIGSLGASLVELAVSRRYVRPPLFGKVAILTRPFYDFGILLCVSSILFLIFSSMGLVMLKILGGTLEAAGIYGAAQNLSIIPGLFGMSFSPLLLSTVSRLLFEGRIDQAKSMGFGAMRMVVGLFPFGALVAGAAPEIVTLVFGQSFELAGPILGVLIMGAIAFVMVSVAVVIATASGAPLFTLYLSIPLVVLVLIGNLVMIPRFGAFGAAMVTALCQGIGALASLFAINRLWGIFPPIGTFLRGAIISVLAYTLAVIWPTSGLLLMMKIGCIGVVIILAYFVLREFSHDEIALARSFIGSKAETIEQQKEM